jgi:hypothetical protein
MPAAVVAKARSILTVSNLHDAIPPVQSVLASSGVGVEGPDGVAALEPKSGIVDTPHEAAVMALEEQGRPHLSHLSLDDLGSALQAGGAQLDESVSPGAAVQGWLATLSQSALTNTGNPAGFGFLFVAEMARAQDPPVDVLNPNGYMPGDLRLTLLDAEILISSLVRLSSALPPPSAGPTTSTSSPPTGGSSSSTPSSNAQSPPPAGSNGVAAIARLTSSRRSAGAAQSAALNSPGAPSQANTGACDRVRDWLAEHLHVESESIPDIQRLTLDFATPFIKKLGHDQAEGFEAFKHIIDAAFIVLRWQRLALLYTSAVLTLQAEVPGPVLRPLESEPPVFLPFTATAGVRQSDLDELARTQESTNVANDINSCILFEMGLPAISTVDDLGKATSTWRVDWSIIQGRRHAEMKPGQIFDYPGRLENVLKPGSADGIVGGQNRVELELKPQRRRLGTPKLARVTVQAELRPHQPPPVWTWVDAAKGSIDPFELAKALNEIASGMMEALVTLKASATTIVKYYDEDYVLSYTVRTYQNQNSYTTPFCGGMPGGGTDTESRNSEYDLEGTVVLAPGDNNTLTGTDAIEWKDFPTYAYSDENISPIQCAPGAGLCDARLDQEITDTIPGTIQAVVTDIGKPTMSASVTLTGVAEHILDTQHMLSGGCPPGPDTTGQQADFLAVAQQQLDQGDIETRTYDQFTHAITFTKFLVDVLPVPTPPQHTYTKISHVFGTVPGNIFTSIGEDMTITARGSTG